MSASLPPPDHITMAGLSTLDLGRKIQEESFVEQRLYVCSMAFKVENSAAWVTFELGNNQCVV